MPEAGNYSRDKLFKSDCFVREDLSRLVVFPSAVKNEIANEIIKNLKQDDVVLVQNVEPDQADALIFAVAEKLGLSDSLAIQSAFASSKGHRKNIGKYYMSVNERSDYQFVTPHSEGSSFINMQLASFYCYENSTDGGETILMNIDESFREWDSLREVVRRGKSNRVLTPSDIRKIKMVARLNMPEDTIGEFDEIMHQYHIDKDFIVYDALAKPVTSYSILLERNVYTYWDSIEAIDMDSVYEFYNFLKVNNLLKNSAVGLDVDLMDDSKARRIRGFGSKYNNIFKCHITRKLQPGDFIIQNNLTWCHAVANWTPRSGNRMVSAAFA